MNKSDQLKEYSRKLRKDMTDAEKKLWFIFRNRSFSGYKFRRQFTLGSYIVDFVCLERKVIIELDGGQHLEQIEYDEKRTIYLNECGFTVLRFWNNDVLTKPVAVLELIHAALTDK